MASDFAGAMTTAIGLVIAPPPDLIEIVELSLYVTLSAVGVALFPALLCGAALAVCREFRTHGLWVGLLNALMGLPPVVVGLFLYMILSRSGPLAPLELLYTPTAMIIAQGLLVFPIIAALTYQTVSDYHMVLSKQLRALGCGRWRMMLTLLNEARYGLITAIMAGFGRATAEVGAVLIVGGNIYHVTRVMTTTIVLETGKGNLVFALALGIILITLSLLITICAQTMRHIGEARAAR